MVKELISTLEEVQEDAFTQPLQSMLAVYVISAPRSPFVLAAVERRKERHVVVVRAGVAFPPNEFVAPLLRLIHRSFPFNYRAPEKVL